MTPVKVRDINGSFWRQNPTIALMSPFNDFKKKDKKSDKIMMAIYLMYDAKSEFVQSGMSQEQIVADVNKNFLEDTKFDWDKHQDIIDAYKDVCTSRIKKKLDELLYEIDQISEAVRDLSWGDPGEYVQKDFLLKASKVLIKDFTELQKELDEEIAELLFEGDYMPSLLEELTMKA